MVLHQRQDGICKFLDHDLFLRILIGLFGGIVLPLSGHIGPTFFGKLAEIEAGADLLFDRVGCFFLGLHAPALGLRVDSLMSEDCRGSTRVAHHASNAATTPNRARFDTMRIVSLR